MFNYEVFNHIVFINLPFFVSEADQLEDVFRRQLLQTEFLSKTYHKDYYAYFINTSMLNLMKHCNK